MICVKFTGFLRLASRLACRLATIRKSVRKFWFCRLGSTCVDLRVRLARALICGKVFGLKLRLAGLCAPHSV